MAKQRYRPTYREVVGGNVLRHRRALGLTQARLGEEVEPYLGQSWPKQVVSAIERGRRALDVEELFAVAQVLEIRVERLLAPWWSDSVMEGTDQIKFPSGKPVLAEHIRDALSAPDEEARARLIEQLQNAISELGGDVVVTPRTVRATASVISPTVKSTGRGRKEKGR